MDLSNPAVDPLGALTPEADAALHEARDARSRSTMLRKQSDNLMNNVNNTQQGVHKSVNSGLTGKVAETVALKVSPHGHQISINIDGNFQGVIGDHWKSPMCYW